MLLTKDIIRVEQYRPNPADPSFVVDITPETLDHWSQTFRDMKNATDPRTGEEFPIDIPLTFEHPPKGKGSDPSEWKSGDPRFRAGWVEDVYRDGDTLMAVLDVPDDYAKDLLDSGCFVSPKFGGTWTDSLSREWKNPIHHIALTTKPVAVNQSRSFSPALAFSRDADNLNSPFASVLEFSTSSGAFSQWHQETPVAALTQEEAINQLFENPAFVELARKRIEEMPESQFSDDYSQPMPAPGMPPGMPMGDDMEPDGDEGGDATAICMQLLSTLSSAIAEAMQSIAALGGSGSQQLPPPPMAPAAPQGQDFTAQPAVQMSRDEEFKDSPLFRAMSKKLTVGDRERISGRIESLFDEGKCTRVEADEMLADAGKYEFSRQKDTENVVLLKMIERLEKREAGSAIPAIDKGVQFSRGQSQTDDGEPTDERVDEILAQHFGF